MIGGQIAERLSGIGYPWSQGVRPMRDRKSQNPRSPAALDHETEHAMKTRETRRRGLAATVAGTLAAVLLLAPLLLGQQENKEKEEKAPPKKSAPKSGAKPG